MRYALCERAHINRL